MSFQDEMYLIADELRSIANIGARSGHERRVPMAFELARGERPVPYFDPTP